MYLSKYKSFKFFSNINIMNLYSKKIQKNQNVLGNLITLVNYVLYILAETYFPSF